MEKKTRKKTRKYPETINLCQAAILNSVENRYFMPELLGANFMTVRL